MSDNLMEKVNALGERLKIGGAEMGRKMSAGMSSVSFKVKELFQGQNEADKLVEDATAENLSDPDWDMNIGLCDMINNDKINSIELIRSIKKRITMKNSPRVQYLALMLLETMVKNCEKTFSELAAERVLDEMVKLVDDPQTVVNNRNKVLILIEAWGESSDELRYLPVYEETYKSLKSRGIRFPGRDNESLAPIFTPPTSVTYSEQDSVVGQHSDTVLPIQLFSDEQRKTEFNVARNSIELLSTVLSSSPQQDIFQEDELSSTLAEQCRQSQYTIQAVIQSSSTDDEAILLEALTINDEIQTVLDKYLHLKKKMQKSPLGSAAAAHCEAEPAMIPVAVDAEDSPRFVKEDALVRKPVAISHGGSGSGDDMLDDLDEMIFGKKKSTSDDPGSSAGGDATPKKQNDLISL